MRLIEDLITIFAPEYCIGCDAEDYILCPECSLEYLDFVPERCAFCMKESAGFASCKKCRKSHKLDRVFVTTIYRDCAKEVVHHFKFQGKRSAAKDIALNMASVISGLEPDTIIVNVPTATSRVRQRGFDHSLLLAKQIALMTKLPRQNSLLRIGQERQVGNTRAERSRNVQGKIWVNPKHNLQGAKLLLVDDVFTTGATLDECAKVLRKAGAKSVSAAVFAQKI